jgi:hypothetical protein
MKRKLFRWLLYMWVIVWGAIFITSAYNHIVDLPALIMCLVGLILWARYGSKDGR